LKLSFIFNNLSLKTVPMRINRKIQAIAVILFLMGSYLIIALMTEFYLIGGVLIEKQTAKISFGFTTWSIIFTFVLSLFLLMGSILLFRLKKEGRLLINLVLSLGMFLNVLLFIIPEQISDNVVEGVGFFVSYRFLPSWQFVFEFIIIIFVLIAVNLKDVKKELS